MSGFSTVSSANLLPTTKLRCLPLKEANKVINILNRNNCWKELATIITHPDNPNELLLTSDNISTLELQWKNGSSPGEALFHHWSTYGLEQPNLKDLIQFLREAGLLRAVREVQNDLLNDYSGDNSDSEIVDIINLTQNEKPEFPEVDIIAEALTDINLEGMPLFSYNELKLATKNFCDKSLDEEGCKIGEGAYGCVYKGCILTIDEGMCDVAVKMLKDPVDKQFITELNILTKFKHENLLPLLGCSINGPNCCLVYQYMPNGSLQERLACIGNSQPMLWTTRLYIAYGSALGINHLHTFGEKPMVHRDIKSANILLDENFVPKVGDFGLVRIGSSTMSTTVAVTGNVYGTCIYMAREAFCGDVSIKLDSFSFGVVLLELLTGLPPFDVTREDRDLVTHVENCDDIFNILDPKTNWKPEAASDLYKISKLCLTDAKRVRPAISTILDDLKKCLLYADEE